MSWAWECLHSSFGEASIWWFCSHPLLVQGWPQWTGPLLNCQKNLGEVHCTSWPADSPELNFSKTSDQPGNFFPIALAFIRGFGSVSEDKSSDWHLHTQVGVKHRPTSAKIITIINRDMLTNTCTQPLPPPKKEEAESFRKQKQQNTTYWHLRLPPCSGGFILQKYRFRTIHPRTDPRITLPFSKRFGIAVASMRGCEVVQHSLFEELD